MPPVTQALGNRGMIGINYPAISEQGIRKATIYAISGGEYNPKGIK